MATTKQRSWNGGGTMPDKRCQACGAQFYTQVGIDEHTRLGCGNSNGSQVTVYRPRTYTEAGRASLQERGRQVAALMNSQRVRCGGCELVSTPAGVGVHQRFTGHTGRVVLS